MAATSTFWQENNYDASPKMPPIDADFGFPDGFYPAELYCVLEDSFDEGSYVANHRNFTSARLEANSRDYPRNSSVSSITSSMTFASSVPSPMDERPSIISLLDDDRRPSEASVASIQTYASYSSISSIMSKSAIPKLVRLSSVRDAPPTIVEISIPEVKSIYVRDPKAPSLASLRTSDRARTRCARRPASIVSNPSSEKTLEMACPIPLYPAQPSLDDILDFDKQQSSDSWADQVLQDLGDTMDL